MRLTKRVNTTIPEEFEKIAQENGIMKADALKVGILQILALKKQGFRDRKKIIRVSKALSDHLGKSISEMPLLEKHKLID